MLPSLGHPSLYNPSGISIGSAVFAQRTADYRRRCRSMPFPSKLPLPNVDLNPHPRRGSLGSLDSSSQTLSRSVQPFMHISPQTVPIGLLYNGPPSTKIAPSHGRSGQYTVPWAHVSPAQPKHHLDRFTRFCRVHGRASIYFRMRPFPQNCPFPWGS